MKLFHVRPDLMVLTNAVRTAGLSWREHEASILEGGSLQPLVVAPVRRNGRRAYIILDGNHRACLSAKHRVPIKAYVLSDDREADQIIELEYLGTIPYFPHRDFLSGQTSLRELVAASIKAAQTLNLTIGEVLDT